MKTTIIILLLIAVAVGGWFIWKDNNTIENPTSEPNATTTNNGGVRAMSAEDYFRLNISQISNQFGTPEVLGGTFYVTKFEAKDGIGTVEYEDGHIAVVADFTYTVAENGAITINSFVVRN